MIRLFLIAGLLGLLTLHMRPCKAADKTFVANEIAFAALMVLDYKTTLDIKNHPGIYETNPILGRHPSDGYIATYFVTAAALQFVVATLLPKQYQPYFQYVTIGLEVGAVSNNVSMGLKFNF